VRAAPRFADPDPRALKIGAKTPICTSNSTATGSRQGIDVKSTLKGLLIATILTALPLAGASAAAPTKDEVVAVVKKAAEFYKTNGRDKSLAEFNKKDGMFAKGEDYVDVHDLNGVCVAHPISPAKVGLNRLDSTDSAGKFYVKDLVDSARQKPSGWIEYVMKNPTTGKLENKTAYWEVHDGLIFKAGTYTK
jgi:cytochrome c